MKYVLTGGAGHTAGPIAEQLVAAGKDVTVIGRTADHLKDLARKGVKTAIGSLEDWPFLEQTFSDADAVYTLIPPNDTAADFRAYQQKVGTNLYNAIKKSRITHVVNLSSMGADLKERAGLVNGLADFETLLSTLSNVHVKNLRPGLFLYNQLKQIPLIKARGVMGSNYAGNVVFPLVDPTDVVMVAVEELITLSFTGKSSRHIVSEETTPDEFARVLGTAIGKPDLAWVFMPDVQLMAGILTSGVTGTMADALIEMGQTINSGDYVADYLVHKPALGTHKISDFATLFAATYNAPDQLLTN
jgi:uncharacterized protein YbjT (DUF2867 family)